MASRLRGASGPTRGFEAGPPTGSYVHPRLESSLGGFSPAKDVPDHYTLCPAVVTLGGPILFEVLGNASPSTTLTCTVSPDVPGNPAPSHGPVAVGVSSISSSRSLTLHIRTLALPAGGEGPVVRFSIKDPQGTTATSDVPLVRGLPLGVQGQLIDHRIFIVIPPGLSLDGLTLDILVRKGSRETGDLPFQVEVS